MADIRENITVGIDLGITSCGWAVLDPPAQAIIAAGSWVFDAPEYLGTVTEYGKQKKRKMPTNAARRAHRGTRKVIGRRSERMGEIRRLFADSGLISDAGPRALWIKVKTAEDKEQLLDPIKMRAEGLHRLLSGPEFAVALGHIAKHRGFKSNSKRDRGANAPKEGEAVLRGVEAFKDALAKYETVGEALFKDPAFADRKRNRAGDYTRTPQRDDNLAEVQRLFMRQKGLESRFAMPQLQDSFVKIAFRQLPIANSEQMVGPCPFERGEPRAARSSYSFERFRLLSRLVNLKVAGLPQRRLTPGEICKAMHDFGSQRGLTFTRLRTVIGLPDGAKFVGVAGQDEGGRNQRRGRRSSGKNTAEATEEKDVVARSGSAMPGSYALRQQLGESVWASLIETPDKLDDIAFVLSFRDDIEMIREGLEEICIDSSLIQSLMAGVTAGDFSDFRRAGHISAKAARNLIPKLQEGKVYSEACAAFGYDHTAPNATPLALLPRPATRMQIQAALADTIGSPVARKAFTESLKQFDALVQAFGLPGKVHIELARDVGKSAEEREKIDFGIHRRTEEKVTLRKEFEEIVGSKPIEGIDDLLRYELWKEQEHRCVYTDEYIEPTWLRSSDNIVQIDHILPWSRFCDDSFVNLTLCMAKANQDKGNDTPFEWFEREGKPWAVFEARVEWLKMKGRKKRNLLLQDAKPLEEKSCNRNLNDTRYAARVFQAAVECFYPKEERRSGEKERRRVFARPGALTDRLRQAWGVQHLKKVNGVRVPDQRHHALDAMVVAATSESALQNLTKQFQASELLGLARPFIKMSQPWPGFIEQMKEKFDAAIVARGERRRARGEAHGATIRQVTDGNNGPEVYERVKVEDLALKDLDRTKDAERNANLIANLRAWIAAGKPKDIRPLSPKGDPVRKVALRTNRNVDVLVRGGAADRGDMARVDVFKCLGKYCLVPVYPHQVFDKKRWPSPPNRAVKGDTPENEWLELNDSFVFQFSVCPFSFVELVKPDGEVVAGYFRKLDRNTGAVTVSPHNRPDQSIRNTGPRNLKSFCKFSIDRLGQIHEIKRETRTWHGVACT